MFRNVAAPLALLLVSAAAATQPVAPAAPSFGKYDPPLEFKETVVTSQYVAMRDGVRIAVSIVRPAVNGRPVDGRFPVIWNASLDIGSPNADGGPINVSGGRYGMSRIVGHGYVVMTAARRGSGASFGRRRGYHDRTEAYDSYELTEWAAHQPWSNGKVGMFGCSNTGEAVLHAMTSLPPSLVAVFTGCFSWNKFDGFTRGGIIANWGTGPTRTIDEDMKSTPVQGDKDRVQLRQAAEEHQGSTNLFDLMISMPYRDTSSPLTLTRFWSEGSVSSYQAQLATSKVYSYVQDGWFDDFRAQNLIAWANLPNRPKVIIGPWTHCATNGFEDGVGAEALRFFDEHLKGIDTGIDRDSPIHYFTINAPAGTAWRSAMTWPLPGTDVRTLFLSAGGRLTGQPVGPTAAEFRVTRTSKCPPNPQMQNGVPGSAVALAQPCHIPGEGASWNMPVRVDTEITGDPLVDVWIISTAPDEHVFAYLEDVAPDGKVSVVTEGRLRASLRQLNQAPWKMLGLPWHRGYKEDAQALAPAIPARLQFDMLPTSYVFKAGHRLQITVTGWDPRERQAASTESRIKVLSDRGHQSAVMLPFAPPAYSVAYR